MRGSGVPARNVAEQHLLTSGEEVISREFLTSTSVSASTGQLRLTFFTARKSETTSQVRVYSGGTAAAATPTLCRIGLYSVAADGSATLVASTANDTALFAAVTTAYTKSWTTPYAKVAGQRYAIGVLVVSATTMPTLCGQPVALSAENLIAPVMSGVLNSQADLPASIAAGALSGSATRLYAAILP